MQEWQSKIMAPEECPTPPPPLLSKKRQDTHLLNCRGIGQFIRSLKSKLRILVQPSIITTLRRIRGIDSRHRSRDGRWRTFDFCWKLPCLVWCTSLRLATCKSLVRASYFCVFSLRRSVSTRFADPDHG